MAKLAEMVTWLKGENGQEDQNGQNSRKGQYVQI